MFKIIQQWAHRYLSHAEAVVLIAFVLMMSMLLMFWGSILAPFILSMIIAYLLDKVVNFLERWGVRRHRAAMWVFVVFLGTFVFVCFTLLPILWEQAVQLVLELPKILVQAEKLSIEYLSEHLYFVDKDKILSMISNFQWEFPSIGQQLLSLSVASIPGILNVLLYFVLVPIMVYFFLMDKVQLFLNVRRFFPEVMHHLPAMWQEIDRQMSQYVIGKWWEAVIFSVVTYFVFLYYGLNYTLILAVLVGFSGIIPWVGALLVTIPLMILAIFQWGFTSDLASFFIVYVILLILDGYVLVPLLFSETIKIHPAGIIFSIVFFGQLFGVVGVFFSIPLAILIKVILNYWPINQAVLTS